MSVLYASNGCTLISHKEYIDRIYNRRVVTQPNSDADSKRSFTLKDDVFNFISENNEKDDHIERRHRKINARKLSISVAENPELYKLNKLIESKSIEFLIDCKRNGFFEQSIRIIKKPDDPLFKQLSAQKVIDAPLNGKNTLTDAILTNISDQTYLIPPNCTFTNSCVSRIKDIASDFYDFIVIDPPWWNKFIRRVRGSNRDEGYDMLYNEDIYRIPLEDLVHPNTIVAIWCTNSPTHSEFIRSSALSKWNLKLLGTYYWVKITKSGDPICEFHAPLRKQPYEKLFLATHIESEHIPRIDEFDLIFSVPSVVHSHKPPLLDIFKHYLPAQPKCLEIFARYLLPNFTSIGREVLKLQNTILFDEIQPG